MTRLSRAPRRPKGALLAQLRLMTIIRGVIGLVLLGVLVAVLMPGLRHEYTLWHLRGALAELEHPTGTTEIKGTSAVGLLSGNGNHCDFATYQVRTGDL